MGRSQAARRLFVFAAGLGLLFAMVTPVAGRAQKQDQVTADLDGSPIDPSRVGNWYCHDFDYPAIHCFSDPARLEESSTQAQDAMRLDALASGDFATALAGATYVTVYEYPTYQGAFMQMSENYSLLSLIGWNDRISSFKVRNSLSGAFWTDWLYSGTKYNFCCNQELSQLGSFDDTFSSVYHN